MPMHMHGQELQQIDGRYTDTQETEIDRKLSMYYADAYVTSSASSDSSARSNAAKKNGAKWSQRASRADQL